MTRRMLAAGNWKMNGLGASISELGGLIAGNQDAKAEILICPPATLIAAMAELSRGHNITIGAQDCHTAPSGAHTGDISAEMVADAGGAYVIVGHSERRADHGESDAVVRAKTEAAWRAGLKAIVCCGETEAERDAGKALSVVAGQLDGSIPDGATAENLVVAYEPVWAIGTGRTPSLDDIAEVHDAIRAQMVTRFGDEIGNDVRLLYGGSVKPGNAAEIFAIENVDGGLVGGASLKASDFTAIIAAASA
ncbi:triose-phosphate isomerase [Rhodobacteraceae bacterium NNCM2]|nr:triose-phosphate isomerase [Coraliihabitans acroporae]